MMYRPGDEPPVLTPESATRPTPVQAASRFCGADGSRDPAFWFAPFERADLDPLDGRDVLRLQRHLGTETIEFARRAPACVVGPVLLRRARPAHHPPHPMSGCCQRWGTSCLDLVSKLGVSVRDLR